MRAVFSVNLPAHEDGTFPSTEELWAWLRKLPWEPAELKAAGGVGAGDEVAAEAALLRKAKELADPLFEQMPEVAAAEKDDVVFCGYIADDQTRFVVTRPVEGQVTFRLLHPVLPRLQASARKMAKKVTSASLLNVGLAVADNRIVVYERGYDHIIITGRVISRPIRETTRTNLKDLLLAVVPSLLAIPVFAFIWVSESHAAPTLSADARFLLSSMERLSTALVTTALVSTLGLLTTYADIKRNRVISWDVSRDSDADTSR